MRIRYCFVEGDKSQTANSKITHDKQGAGLWKKGTVKTSDFQKWDQLTFKIEITLYNVFDTEQDDITDKYLKHEEKKTDANELDAAKLYSFTWTITDPKLIKEMISSKPGKLFSSPIYRLFNFTWQLEILPTGKHEQPGNVYLFLNLCGLSPKVDFIHAWRQCTFVEQLSSIETHVNFSHDKMYAKSWKSGVVKTEALHNFQQLTFKVDIKLYTVFDTDGD
eukprot:55121_1